MPAANFKGHGLLVCSECGGLGIKKSTLKDICPECSGEGKLFVSMCCQISPLAKNDGILSVNIDKDSIDLGKNIPGRLIHALIENFSETMNSIVLPLSQG